MVILHLFHLEFIPADRTPVLLSLIEQFFLALDDIAYKPSEYGITASTSLQANVADVEVYAK
jgi:hypothetical protein